MKCFVLQVHEFNEIIIIKKKLATLNSTAQDTLLRFLIPADVSRIILDISTCDQVTQSARTMGSCNCCFKANVKNSRKSDPSP